MNIQAINSLYYIPTIFCGDRVNPDVFYVVKTNTLIIYDTKHHTQKSYKFNDTIIDVYGYNDIIFVIINNIDETTYMSINTGNQWIKISVNILNIIYCENSTEFIDIVYIHKNHKLYHLIWNKSINKMVFNEPIKILNMNIVPYDIKLFKHKHLYYLSILFKIDKYNKELGLSIGNYHYMFTSSNLVEFNQNYVELTNTNNVINIIDDINFRYFITSNSIHKYSIDNDYYKDDYTTNLNMFGKFLTVSKIDNVFTFYQCFNKKINVYTLDISNKILSKLFNKKPKLLYKETVYDNVFMSTISANNTIYIIDKNQTIHKIEP